MNLTEFCAHNKNNNRLLRSLNPRVYNYQLQGTSCKHVIIILYVCDLFLCQCATPPVSDMSLHVCSLIVKLERKHWPFPLCWYAAPPSLWQMSPCWSFFPPGRIQPVWSGGSFAAALWGPSGRAEAASAGPAQRLPTGTPRAPLRPLPRQPCPEQASPQQLASRTRPGPHVASPCAHNWIQKQDSPYRTNMLTHKCTQADTQCWSLIAAGKTKVKLKSLISKRRLQMQISIIHSQVSRSFCSNCLMYDSSFPLSLFCLLTSANASKCHSAAQPAPLLLSHSACPCPIVDD